MCLLQLVATTETDNQIYYTNQAHHKYAEHNSYEYVKVDTEDDSCFWFACSWGTNKKCAWDEASEMLDKVSRGSRIKKVEHVWHFQEERQMFNFASLRVAMAKDLL